MSMDELLLQELYGSQQVQAEQQIKQAQVELVEAVAAQAGVDLNELDDEELAKFAHYVLSDEDEAEAEYDYAEPDSSLDKLAEADMVGRQMAHSYADELGRIQETQVIRSNVMSKVASAMDDIAEAWYAEKVANETAPAASRGAQAAQAVDRIADAVGAAVDKVPRDTAGRAEALKNALTDLAAGQNPLNKITETVQGLGNTARAEGMTIRELARQEAISESLQAIASATNVPVEQVKQIVAAGSPLAEEKLKALTEPTLMQRAGRLTGILQSGDEKLLGARGGRLAGTALGLGALGYGGYRALRNDDGDNMNANEKVSMLLGLEKSAGMFGSTRSERIMQKLRQLGGSAGRATGVLRTRGEGVGKRSLRGAATLAGAAGLGYGAYRARRAMSGNEKVSMLIDAGYPALAIAIAHTPEEFAKEAEYRAAEILLAQGVDPATLEDVEPEYVKIASFPGVEEAADMDEAEALDEYNEMLNTAALHILDELLND